MPGSLHAIFQFGNLGVVAPWLDLTSKLSVKQSFSLLTAKGRIGMFQKTESEYDRFQGIVDEFARIDCASTEDVSTFVERYPKLPLPPDTLFHIEDDGNSVDIDFLLITAGVNCYHVLQRVQTQHHSRFRHQQCHSLTSPWHLDWKMWSWLEHSTRYLQLT